MVSDAQRALQAIRDQRDNPNLPVPSNWNSEYPLRKYQRVGVSHLLVMRRFVLGHCVGCHEKGQGILMYNGSIKKVEDVEFGDLLMGPDSEPKVVLDLIRGTGNMFRVTPKKGKSWVVNEDHILTLRLTGSDVCHQSPWRRHLKPVVDVSVRDWLKWPNYKKQDYKLFKVGVEFPEIDESGLIDPYHMGFLLGDGGMGNGVSITGDSLAGDVAEEIAKCFSLNVRMEWNSALSDVYHPTCRRRGGFNGLVEYLRDQGLYGVRCEDKFVPQEYLITSRYSRLRLLAGLLDTDGAINADLRSMYDFTVKSDQLAQGIMFLAGSLGMMVTHRMRRVTLKSGFSGLYNRVHIFGDGMDEIPIRLDYKKALSRVTDFKNALMVGIRSIEPEGVGEFYGFSLDGDGRYLLDDFTVTHNSGKTVMGLNAWGIFREQRPSRLFVVTTKSAVSQWGDECRRFLPGVPCVEVPSSEDAPSKERERYYQEWVQTGMGSMLCLSWSQYQRDWEFFLETQDLWKEGTWVILDECQRVRNPKSKLYGITQQLSEIVPRIHGFTATLIKNKAHDALHILNLLNPGTMSLVAFNRTYVIQGFKKVPMRTGKGGGRRFITVKTIDGYKNLKDFASRVSHLYLSPPESEMDLERPEVQTVSRRETMSSFHRRIYGDAERGLFLAGCESDAMAASSALAHAQIAASTPEHFTDLSLPLDVDSLPNVFSTEGTHHFQHKAVQEKNSKLSMLKDLLSTELEDDPVIVYSPFATSIWHLSSALANQNPVVITGSVKQVDRDKARMDFQGGKSNLMLMTDAGGEALNLQRAKHVIFYSLPWTVGQYIQVIGRARRFGSEHQYLGVWHLLMMDSVDELVESILQPKALQFEALLSSNEPVAEFAGSLAVEVARRMRKVRIAS